MDITKTYTPRGPDVKTKPTLIDIGETAMHIHDLLRESEGELTPELEAAMDNMLSNGQESLDAAAWVVRQLAGEQSVCEIEAKRYKERAASKERQVEALKGRMLFAVDAAFGGKLKTARNLIWGQDSAPTVGFDVAPDADLEQVAKDQPTFVRRKYELDKLALKRALDAGEAIPNAIAVTENPGKRSLRIR
jgi:hypothetical protein